ncbi:GCD complex subunit gcd7 [Malassezia vespertilionis]|uniref:Translation initiation factor eIF2B subunit beta n=1 Tax=Malassezia vespertilionis TaxID=2020962 RepID=A0A2N1JG04_9BASI|nr:GCD complex subunit gcd7 [Malassezia vespertilionis]PKI85477.1 Gcd7p [Malassezia vespertilionis]WFD04789.1 GCD complex subunit gcd7 [Malassezia vespertilionis]
MAARTAADKTPYGNIDDVVRDRAALLSVKELSMQLRRQQLSGTEVIAEATAKIIRGVVSSAKYWRLEELMRMIRIVGRYLQDSLPSDPVIGNITRRILFLLREEARAAAHLEGGAEKATPHPSVAQSLAALSLSPSAPSSPATSIHTSRPVDVKPISARSFSISDLVNPNAAHAAALSHFSIDHVGSSMHDALSELDSDSDSEQPKPQGASSHAYQLKPLLIQAIQELIDEIESADVNIAKDAKDHIHSGEVILTLGASSTVRSFLRSAAKHRKFITVIPESAPSFNGHALARSLSSAGLSVLLVPDSNLYALMPRVSKVILGARCVLANGGILSSIGAKSIAMAAREHSTPIVALAGVYKISPDWTWVGPERLAGGNQGPVNQVVNYASSNVLAEYADIVNPLWDLVSPNELDLIITNVGEHPPSYVYRLIQENYHEEDLNF